MPTITLQVGQCGNQLGASFWQVLQQQQSRCNSSSTICKEWFASTQLNEDVAAESDTAAAANQLQPRCICVDSEAKVVKRWDSTHTGMTAGRTGVHVLGKGGGCGNNWSCGYNLAFTAATHRSQCAWSGSDDQHRWIDQVLQGIRCEAEREAGVPDFLLLSSLAGGTGSGFGSALLESLADAYPCSTVAAAVVAPGRAGGSDTATQSINCCLALQHLSQYSHAVLLLDNQVMLDQLNASISRQARTTSSTTSSSSAGRAGGAGSLAAVSGRACLQGVNQLAAQALLGLLWPVGEADQLARRTNIRQLASSIAADNLTKFLEVCHLSAPDAELPVNMLNNPWPSRIKLLASQLPSYDPFHPSQKVTTSAAFLVARGALCSQPLGQSRSSTGARFPASGYSSGSSSTRSIAGGLGSSCWVGGAGVIEGGSSSNSGWSAEAAVCAVGSSWPCWEGSSWDVTMADCILPLWSPASGKCTSSLTAAVRRSSTGSFLRDVASKCMRLCGAGAYMHWYEQFGTEAAEIEAAADVLADLAYSY